jgi:hypothetical protein
VPCNASAVDLPPPRTDQLGAPAGRDPKAENHESCGRRDRWRDVSNATNAMPASRTRGTASVLAQAVRLQQGADRLGQARHVLRHVD